MIRTLHALLLLSLLGPGSGLCLLHRTIDIPLSYNYLPGEPFWAKYGSIDNRKIQLLVGHSRQVQLGSFNIEGTEQYTLLPDGSLTEYLDRAAGSVLSHYGVNLQQNGDYRLYIIPEMFTITSLDNDEDGRMLCTVRLWARYYAPDTSHLFTAIISNTGSREFADDDDELEYADLLDRTVHGALVKLWGSQVLYTGEQLGRGRIKKTGRGRYAFFKDSLADTTANTLPDFDPTGYHLTAPPVTKLSTDPIVTSEDSAISAEKAAGGGAVFSGSRRISVGILPFENGTGNEKLTSFVKSAQQRFSQTLSRSGSVAIMERGKLNDILKEQALGLSGIMNDTTVVKVGNISGLQVMAAGEVTTSGSRYRISARLINVETSAIVASTSLLLSDALQIAESGAELAARMLYKYTEEKVEINRNTMLYPSIVPQAIPAVTASTEDAWAVEFNPASIMKISERDAAFHSTFYEKIAGRTPEGEHVSTIQPPYSDMGLNLVYPVNGFFGTGLGIRHLYNYPRLDVKTEAGSYNYREEETVFTLPAAFGFTPKLSFGISLLSHVTESYQMQPGRPTATGNSLSINLLLGTLFKVSERFRIGATYRSAMVFDKTEQETGNDVDENVDRPSPHSFRVGAAMYPLRWFFFFGDLEYQKYSHVPQAHPGFHLGMQFTGYGRPAFLPFLPRYGMVPLYIGYSHSPYNRLTGTQDRYFSFGSGYCLNNIYLQWAFRINTQSEDERKAAIGTDDYKILLDDYLHTAPLFFCVGYRF